MSGVKVGVRIRPFLLVIDGEDKLCIDMTDTATTVTDVHDSQDSKTFTFDYSFWSFDGFEAREDGYSIPVAGGKYKDQEYVFNEMG